MTLYMVATPIGNLEDITIRALSVLGSVSCVYAEDTRVTKRLLQKYDIHTPLESFHARSSEKKTAKIINDLSLGKDIALVTDAGTPGISDPGTKLVADVIRALPTTVVRAVPGPSALSAALSIAGVPNNQFRFLGFLPHKRGRETLFRAIASEKDLVIFFESPHRILKTLHSLKDHVPHARVVLVREMTKIYEERLEGTPDALIDLLTQETEKQKGEFVVLVAPKRPMS